MIDIRYIELIKLAMSAVSMTVTPMPPSSSTPRSYNPEIANPHWIYPGNEVRFFNSGEEVPTQVEVGQPATEVEESEFYDDKVSVFGQIGFRPKNSQTIASPGFVTSREVEDSGKIVGSFAESMELTYADRIYVQFTKKAPRVGEIYLVFRNAGEVIHPILA